MANDKQAIRIDWYEVRKAVANIWLILVSIFIVGLFLAGFLSLLCNTSTRPFGLVMGGMAAFTFITMWAIRNS